MRNPQASSLGGRDDHGLLPRGPRVSRQSPVSFRIGSPLPPTHACIWKQTLSKSLWPKGGDGEQGWAPGPGAWLLSVSVHSGGLEGRGQGQKQKQPEFVMSSLKYLLNPPLHRADPPRIPSNLSSAVLQTLQWLHASLRIEVPVAASEALHGLTALPLCPFSCSLFALLSVCLTRSCLWPLQGWLTPHFLQIYTQMPAP